MVNKRKTKRVLDEGVAGQVSGLLQNVVKQGTATRAQIPGVMVAGKTGTTENYGDAWFVGWTKEYTVAVWVGYPDEFKPMKTEFQGDPVAGGTFPAGIWKSFMQSLLKIDPLPKKDGGDGTGKDLDPGADAHAGCRDGPAADRHRAAGLPETPQDDGGQPQRRRRRRPRSNRRPPRRATAAHRGAAAGDRSGNRGWRSGAPGLTTGRAKCAAGWPGARDVPRADGAEAPRELGGLGDADPHTGHVRPPLALVDRIGPLTSEVSFSESSIPSAWVSLPGPFVSCDVPRRSNILSSPRSGSSARISTAAPTPSGSQTALSRA